MAASRRTALVTLSRHYYASWARNGDLALRLAQETVELAQRCGDQAIETEALLRYGQELFGQGWFDVAETVLAAGYDLATAAGLPILAALSLERQASILEKVGSWLDDGGQINGIGRFGQWGHGPEPSGEAEQGS